MRHLATSARALLVALVLWSALILFASTAAMEQPALAPEATPTFTPTAGWQNRLRLPAWPVATRPRPTLAPPLWRR